MATTRWRKALGFGALTMAALVFLFQFMKGNIPQLNWAYEKVLFENSWMRVDVWTISHFLVPFFLTAWFRAPLVVLQLLLMWEMGERAITFFGNDEPESWQDSLTDMLVGIVGIVLANKLTRVDKPKLS
eukprot:GILK01011595.1.p1 GENE.GILK01011595.1~~GILK01011595.1.p1  ORF type:complete len:141 (-),score=7.20 GILK01011595.1:159-545(-)